MLNEKTRDVRKALLCRRHQCGPASVCLDVRVGVAQEQQGNAFRVTTGGSCKEGRPVAGAFVVNAARGRFGQCACELSHLAQQSMLPDLEAIRRAFWPQSCGWCRDG